MIVLVSNAGKEIGHMFEKVVIVGPGLIGGSLGMALRSARLAGKVVGVSYGDRRRAET